MDIEVTVPVEISPSLQVRVVTQLRKVAAWLVDYLTRQVSMVVRRYVSSNQGPNAVPVDAADMERELRNALKRVVPDEFDQLHIRDLRDRSLSSVDTADNNSRARA
jgi:hypothetical protein